MGIQHLLPPRSGRGYLYNVRILILIFIKIKQNFKRVFDIIDHLKFTNIQTMIISICSIFFLLFTQQIFEVINYI